MQNLKDTRQIPLFDSWAQAFSTRLYEKLRTGWQGLFHDVLLKLMPAEELAQKFHPDVGRPTKELYSVAGLIFLKNCNDWTDEQAVEALQGLLPAISNILLPPPTTRTPQTLRPNCSS